MTDTSTSAPDCTVSSRREGEVVLVTVVGQVTERTDLTPMIGVTGPSVVLDVAGIRRFNSGGVTLWLRAIAELSSKAGTLAVVGLREHFIYQLLLTPGLIGTGRVDSLYLTYFCPACEAVSHVLATRASCFPTGALLPPPAPPCPDCSVAMEFDTVLDGLRL